MKDPPIRRHTSYQRKPGQIHFKRRAHSISVILLPEQAQARPQSQSMSSMARFGEKNISMNNAGGLKAGVCGYSEFVSQLRPAQMKCAGTEFDFEA
eukprot:scaffold20424_cov82-Skeletonema_dohrnii-CCMP3373.AAC.3